MSKLKVFEAFAGIGSQSMALRNIGIDYEVVGISEVDRYALLSYWAIHHNGYERYDYNNITKDEIIEEIKESNIAYNFSTYKSDIPKNKKDLLKLYNAHKITKNYGDIRLIDENKLPNFDLFTYSFPCKNISIAGEQKGFEEGSKTQSSLLWECRRIIKSKKPKYLLMENVKNLVSGKHKDVFDLWCKELEDMGYNNYWKVLNSKYFKAPQNRERVIMVSILKNIDKHTFIMPNGVLTNVRVKDILEKNTEKTFLIDINKLINPITIEEYKNKNKQLECNKLFQIGTINIKGIDMTKRIYSDYGLCPTLNSMTGGNLQPKFITIENDELIIKKLSPLECWRVMGYSDEDFYKAKNIGNLSNAKLYERAGRGIVVPMLEKVFEELVLK